MPINPVVLESPSELELKLEFMHPNTIPGLSDPPNPNVSDARSPSEDEASA